MRWTFLILIVLCLSTAARAQDRSTRETKKGFFSLGVGYGMGTSRILNTDGSFANYRMTGYFGDLDILLFGGESASVRIFGAYSQMKGQSETASSETIEASELAGGLKFFVGPSFYLAGGVGSGKAKVKSTARELELNFQLVKALLGLELQLSESFFVGLELSYRNGPIKKSDNSALTQNTFIEGVGAGLRLIWSPPSITLISQ